MKNKEEIIREAWMDLGIKTPFGICNNTGYYHGYFCNGLSEILDGFGIKEDQIDFDIDLDGVGKFRPLALKGIETNNGWTKIESETDLPKEYCEMFVVDRENNSIKYREYFNTAKKAFVKLYSHYQPIQKPLPPLH